MLERLSHIDWQSLEVIEGGDATKIPEAIRGLLSDDPLIRQKSYWKLDNVVVVQSDLYEAAWYVIPFLLEILSSTVIHGRVEVYDLLYEIGNGYAPPEEQIVVQVGEVIPLQVACREAVVNGLDLYLEEVQNASSPAREKALELLLSLHEDHGTVREQLEILLSHHSDTVLTEKIRAMLEEWFGKDRISWSEKGDEGRISWSEKGNIDVDAA